MENKCEIRILYGIRETSKRNSPLLGVVFSSEEKANEYIEHMLPKKLCVVEEGSTYNIEYEVVFIRLNPYCSEGYVQEVRYEHDW